MCMFVYLLIETKSQKRNSQRTPVDSQLMCRENDGKKIKIGHCPRQRINYVNRKKENNKQNIKVLIVKAICNHLAEIINGFEGNSNIHKSDIIASPERAQNHP